MRKTPEFQQYNIIRSLGCYPPLPSLPLVIQGESLMPVIDLSFVLVGTTIPLDHGYALFSAICRIVPALHGDRRAGRSNSGPSDFAGRAEPDRLVAAPAPAAVGRDRSLIAVAGESLELDGHRVRLGVS